MVSHCELHVAQHSDQVGKVTFVEPHYPRWVSEVVGFGAVARYRAGLRKSHEPRPFNSQGRSSPTLEHIVMFQACVHSLDSAHGSHVRGVYTYIYVVAQARVRLYRPRVCGSAAMSFARLG